MKKLPIGIQTFSEIIRENYLYVDKTPLIAALISSGKYLFLSRPRRFGKSLLVSTLKEIFSGNQELFRGLFIYDKLDWKAYPVIQIDFSAISYYNDEVFRKSLLSFLNAVAQDFQIVLTAEFLKERFAELIRKLSEQTQSKIVILVDEYDKPIVDYTDHLDQAVKNREILREFYSVLKSADVYLRFVFLTGVSKFSRVSIFSGLNNLEDITLSPRFATLTGYTQAELERDFAEYVHQFCEQDGLAKEELLGRIRRWYNGYSWNAKDTVYNPFSILNLFRNNTFSNYWFATGTPTFLIKLIKTLQLDTTEFENKKVAEMVFESYDLDRLNIFALLFQTGYLTITQIEKTSRFPQYTLNYPNLEVKEAFLTYLFESFTTSRLDEVQTTANALHKCLRTENIEGFMQIIRSLFAKIPYPLHLPQEAYYHSLFYMILALMGVEIDLEVLTDKGRIDGVLALEDTIYLIEFKYGAAGSDLHELTEKAIQQIHEKHYAERFLHDPRKRIFLGVGFTEKEIGYQIEMPTNTI
jgi:hypothetical protein